MPNNFHYLLLIDTIIDCLHYWGNWSLLVFKTEPQYVMFYDIIATILQEFH
jgi:hypothetical protein